MHYVQWDNSTLQNTPVIIGENETTEATTFCEDFLVDNNIELINMNLDQCKLMMKHFIQNNEELWFEDISI